MRQLVFNKIMAVLFGMLAAFTFTSCGENEGENEAPGFLIGEWRGTISGVTMTYTFRSNNSGNVDISGGNNMDFNYVYTEASSSGGALDMVYDDGTSVYAVVVKLSDTKINLVVGNDIITLTKGGSGNNDNADNGDNGDSNNDSQANYTRDILGTWQKSGSSDQITFYSDGTCRQYSSASNKWYDKKWKFNYFDDGWIYALVVSTNSYATVYGIESLTSSKMVLTYNNREYVYYKR